MNRILICSETKNDLTETILASCPHSAWVTYGAEDIPFGAFDALCLPGGDGEAPLTLPPHIRIAAEAMHRAGKPVFCEFLSSFGCVYAYMVTGDTCFYERWKGIAAFMVRCQAHSSDPRTDGAWMRAMDMDRMEAYGVPHDVGWAPCCVEATRLTHHGSNDTGYGIAIGEMEVYGTEHTEA